MSQINVLKCGYWPTTKQHRQMKGNFSQQVPQHKHSLRLFLQDSCLLRPCRSLLHWRMYEVNCMPAHSAPM
ncbi:uncharacterized protein LOC119169695 isoform X2 [Rhipicephalus microplus]|uniref:uncharacterized protein LOC119169695 isoform X2 n=1 Tax=Rhipicephalus microplus TaxID=6941 RepID=UPI003F6D0D0D